MFIALLDVGTHVYLVQCREDVLSARVAQSAEDTGQSSGTSVG